MRLVALAALLISTAASADPIRWSARAGSMQAGARPGSWIVTTDANPGRFSAGEVIADREVALPCRVDVRWQRLGPEGGRSMHVVVAGGVLLVRTGMIALYTYDEVKLAKDGWTAIPALDTQREHGLSVVQTREELRVSLEGKEVARFALPVAREKALVGVGMKGASGFRSTVYLRALSVTTLQ